jgi:UDP-glucose 6-dehydrogenase
MRISVVGTGYVRLVSGVCLAETGHEVICVDVDPGKVEMINRADPPIHERGLAELLKRNVGMRLRATTDLTWSRSCAVHLDKRLTPILADGRRMLDRESVQRHEGVGLTRAHGVRSANESS